MTQDKQQDKHSFLKLMLSTMAAAIGVQSKKKLEEDFSHSSPLPFIAAGVLFTVAFVVALIVVVRIVLASAA